MRDETWTGSGGYEALSAVLDVWLVVLPAWIVWRLNIGRGKKVGIIGVFMAGIL